MEQNFELKEPISPQTPIRQISKEQENLPNISSTGFPKGKKQARLITFFEKNQSGPNVEFTFDGRQLNPFQEMSIKKVMKSKDDAIEFSTGDGDNEPIMRYNLAPLIKTALNEGYLQYNTKELLSLPSFSFVRTALIDNPETLNQLLSEKKVQEAAAKQADIRQEVQYSLRNDDDFLDGMASNPHVRRKVVKNFIDAMNDKAETRINYDSDTNDLLGQLFRHPTVYAESRNFQPAHKRHFYITMGLVGCTFYILGANGFGRSFLEKSRDFILEFIQNRLKTPHA